MSSIAVHRMPRLTSLFIPLAFAGLVSSCSRPPPELTVEQEELVRRCLELAFKQEPTPECAERVTKPMEEAFIHKHPNFYDELVAQRKAFVEERLAEEQRQRDELNRCLDQRERGDATSPACEKFLAHEITRGLRDRRLRRCAEARLDEKTGAHMHCDGLPARVIEEEVAAERTRRERNAQR